VSLTQNVWKEQQVLSLTQENAVDLRTRDDVRRKHKEPLKHKSQPLHELFSHWSPTVNCCVCNKHKVKCTHSSDHTEHYKK
jgi:hypothetical protein